MVNTLIKHGHKEENVHDYPYSRFILYYYLCKIDEIEQLKTDAGATKIGFADGKDFTNILNDYDLKIKELEKDLKEVLDERSDDEIKKEAEQKERELSNYFRKTK